MYKVLAINPGSTSTKIAAFEDDNLIMEKTLRHSSEELSRFESIVEQKLFRKEIILESLVEVGINPNDLDAVVGRGGLVAPIEGGTYEVNDKMVADLKDAIRGEHASNLGALIAREIADSAVIPAYIVDPVVVDELNPLARISGIPEIERVSIFHALNQKAVAKRYAKSEGVSYEDLNLIVAHLGGGISVGAHQKGRVIDVNNALNGDGPFSPERSGGLPVIGVYELLKSNQLTDQQFKKRMAGNGGIVAYLGTNDARTVEERIEQGDEDARLIYQAMAYQVSKEIGACMAVLSCNVDAIIITGGIAYSEMFVDLVKARVSKMAKLVVFPGEDEMTALAEGALRVLNKTEEAKIYLGR